MNSSATMRRASFPSQLLTAVSLALAAIATPALAQNSEPTRAQVMLLQQLLAETGYEPGPADGIAGHRTSIALEQFQTDFELGTSGEISKETIGQLVTVHQRMIKSRGQSPNSPRYSALLGTGSADDGKATALIKRPDAAPPVMQDEPLEREFSLLAVTQEQLDELGYDPGNFEGDFTAETQAALREFQKKAGIPQTGKPDAATNAALNEAMKQEKRNQIEEQRAAGRP